MDRFGIFVDAGYLYAASGKLCHGTVDRSKLVLNAASLHPALVNLTRDDCGLQHLRTYWYDGAPDARPTSQHLDIARLPGIKLRLGRLMKWGQKGVDSRVVRDLIALSAGEAFSTAYLLGGDEDLREGVVEAQEHGMRVVLIAIEPLNEQNLSPTLAMEVDDVITLGHDFISPHIKLREEMKLEDFEITATTDPISIGHQVGSQWWEKTPPEERQWVRRSKPKIPSDLDRSLLRSAARVLAGDEGKVRDLPDEVRKALRSGFWQSLDSLAAASPPGA